MLKAQQHTEMMADRSRQSVGVRRVNRVFGVCVSWIQSSIECNRGLRLSVQLAGIPFATASKFARQRRRQGSRSQLSIHSVIPAFIDGTPCFGSAFATRLFNTAVSTTQNQMKLYCMHDEANLGEHSIKVRCGCSEFAGRFLLICYHTIFSQCVNAGIACMHPATIYHTPHSSLSSARETPAMHIIFIETITPLTHDDIPEYAKAVFQLVRARIHHVGICQPLALLLRLEGLDAGEPICICSSICQ